MARRTAGSADVLVWGATAWTLGLIGAPLLLISDTATLFGVWEQTSGPALLLVLPIAIWEFSFGVYMIVKGLKPATLDESPAPA